MISVSYTPSFVKQAKSLEAPIFEETISKIEKFKDQKNHKSLKVHKLHGRLTDFHSFYINRNIRIIFEYTTKNDALLHDIGRHSIY